MGEVGTPLRPPTVMAIAILTYGAAYGEALLAESVWLPRPIDANAGGVSIAAAIAQEFRRRSRNTRVNDR